MNCILIIISVIVEILKSLDNYATLILAFITGIYVCFTYRMMKLMAKQVIADIQVSNIMLGSNFVEDWFKERMEKQPEKIKKDSLFKFNLLFDVRNKNSGSGSIDKPILILKFVNDSFEYKVFPTTKHTEWKKINANVSEGTSTDLGGTIFLQGGESQKIELDYILCNFDDNLLNHIKSDLSSLEYYVEFTDNLGKNYLMKIGNIKSEREVKRR